MVKKLWIFDNKGPESQETSKRLHELIQSLGRDRTDSISAVGSALSDDYFELDEENPEIVISIGGDGTMLSAFHRYEAQVEKIRFVGVHTGHLGFYTDFLANELLEFINALQNESPERAVRYPLLSVAIKFHNGDEKLYHALNEATIRRGSETLVAEVDISDFLFEKFRGDGLVVSTPTGSTAYNKSIGGAVMDPRVEAMQVAEIASINNRVFRTLGSAMIVAKKDKIRIRPEENIDLLLTIDQNEFDLSNIEEVVFSLDGQTIAFANCAHTPFWERVKNSFIGIS